MHNFHQTNYKTCFLVDFNNVNSFFALILRLIGEFSRFSRSFHQPFGNLICKVATRSIGGFVENHPLRSVKSRKKQQFLVDFKLLKLIHLVRWFALFACPFFILFPYLVGWWMFMVGSNIRQNWISRRPYYRRNCKNDKRW